MPRCLTIPCTAIHRPRAEARAQRRFRNALWRSYPELFDSGRQSMQPHSSSVKDTAIAVARWTQQLAPGPLAELRRLVPRERRPRILASWPRSTPLPSVVPGRPSWMDIVRMIAILTAEGRTDEPAAPARLGPKTGRPSCATEATPRPGVEGVLNHISASAASRSSSQHADAQRAALLVRAVRALARTRPPDAGINVTDLAWAVLKEDDAALLGGAVLPPARPCRAESRIRP